MLKVKNTTDVLIDNWSNRVTIQPFEEVLINEIDAQDLLRTYPFLIEVKEGSLKAEFVDSSEELMDTIYTEEVKKEVETKKPSKKAKK